MRGKTSNIKTRQDRHILRQRHHYGKNKNEIYKKNYVLEIADVKKTYEVIASKMEEKFAHIYQHAVRVASALNVQPSMPRAVGRQTNRDNAPATNPEEYYRRNVAMPLINHINVQLDGQFSGNELKSKTVVSLSKILHIAVQVFVVKGAITLTFLFLSL